MPHPGSLALTPVRGRCIVAVALLTAGLADTTRQYRITAFSRGALPEAEYGATPPEVFLRPCDGIGFHAAGNTIPPMMSCRVQALARVLSNAPLCRDHYRLTLELDAFPQTAPGQFVQIACRKWDLDYSVENDLAWEAGAPVNLVGPELRSPLSLLRKPFSIADRREVSGRVQLDIIHRRVGTGTTWMSGLTNGDQVNLIGPLGNSFPIPQPDQVAIMVGGGVGIPPMVYFANGLAGNRRGVVFAGALSRDLLPLTITADAPAPGIESFEPLYNIDEFSSVGVPAVVCTDDGSWGFRGFVTQALEKYLDAYYAQQPSRAVVYTCGPEAMMRRVAEIAERRDITCYVSVERSMACGMGTCQSCVIRVKNDLAVLPERQWVYKLACTDGPIFDSRRLLW